MLRPDLFGALATHAGDVLYDLIYVREFGPAVRALRAYDGDIWAFWRDFNSRQSFKPTDQTLLLILGIAACYSADLDGTVHLPFNPRTGQISEDISARWLAWDPIRMLDGPQYADAMKTMRGIWVDAGTSDDFYLDLGAQAFTDRLGQIGVPEKALAFELVEANQWTIDSRFPVALRWLAARLNEASATT